MNHLLELQRSLLARRKKTGIVSRKQLPLERKQAGTQYQSPAWTFSLPADPTQDLHEMDLDVVARAHTEEAVPGHCSLRPAEHAATEHFSLEEFRCKDQDKTPVPVSVRGNTQRLMEQLEVLRSELGKPVIVHSGYRTVAYNKRVGGEDQSQHLCGAAADITVSGYSPAQVHEKIEALIASGKMMQGGLGLYDGFVHYDVRGRKSRWRKTSAAAQSWEMSEPSIDYYAWPEKYGRGDARYDQAVAEWIRHNRETTPIFSGLHLVYRKPGDNRWLHAPPDNASFTSLRNKGYQLLGYDYGGNFSNDPAPNWNEPDAARGKGYEIIRDEMRHEGGISSVNTWDNQQLTLGWGFSLRYLGPGHNEGIKVLQYNLDASPELRKAMLEVGLALKDGRIHYFAGGTSTILTGTDAMAGVKWNPRLLSRLITELEKRPQVNADANARALKDIRLSKMPADIFSWPEDSLRLAFSLSHWAPAGIVWSQLSGTNGNLAALVKSFTRNFHRVRAGGYEGAYAISSLANGALYAQDIRTALKKRGRGAFPKAGDMGTIKRIVQSAFTDNYRTDAAYRDYVFVELDGMVYLLP